MTDYITYLAERDLAPDHVTFYFPTLWLFSPGGEILKEVIAKDDPQLEKLKASYPFDADAPALEGRLSLSQTRELLAKSLGTEMPAAGDGIWYAVLFLTNSPKCKHCAGFESGLAEIQTRAEGKLKVVLVNTTK